MTDKVEHALKLYQQVLDSSTPIENSRRMAVDNDAFEALFAFLLADFDKEALPAESAHSFLASHRTILSVDDIRALDEPLVPIAIARALALQEMVPFDHLNGIFSTFANEYRDILISSSEYRYKSQEEAKAAFDQAVKRRMKEI